MLNLLTQYRKYGPAVSSQDIIKFIALIIMIIDHTGHYFFSEDLWWRAVGRIGFPIWFFLAGYARPGKTPLEMYVGAVLLIVVDLIFHQPLFPVNALVTILLCREFTAWLDRKQYSGRQVIPLFIILTMFFPATFLLFEYGTLAILFAVCGYLRKHFPESIALKQAFILAFFCFIGTQEVVYSFKPVDFIIMTTGTAATMAYLYHYNVTFSAPRTDILSNTVKFLSRNTLYIYLFHIPLFVVLAYYLSPEKYQEFRWL